MFIFPVVCVKYRPELCHQLVESDLSPAKLLGAQSLLGGGPGRRVVTAGDAGDFLHIDSDWAFFKKQRGVLVGIGSGRRATGGGSAVEESSSICDSDLIERNGGLMLNGREEARGCLQRVLENETGREFFRVSST